MSDNSVVANFFFCLSLPPSLRCQSLINLKLYKMSRHELKECQKIIGDHIQKANQQSSPVPSPAGSEGSVCSKSSGYTSAGEAGQGANRLVMTSPSNSSNSAATQCLSVPQSVMQKQHLFCNFLSQSHELWEMADVYAQRGHCEGESERRMDWMNQISLLFSCFRLHHQVGSDLWRPDLA